MIRQLLAYGSLTLVSLACAACGSRPGACPPATPAKDAPLVALEEHTEDGRCIPVPKSGIVEIDVNSTLELRMNEPAIKARMLSQANAQVDERARELDKRLSLLIGIVEARDREVEYLTALMSEIHQLDPPARAPRVMEFGKLRGAFRKAVGEYAERIDAPKADFLRPRTGDALIQEHLRKTQEDSQNLVADLQGLSWRVEAALDKGGGQAQLHVENYDKLKSGAVRRFDKMSPATPEVVAQQFEKAKALSKQIEELGRDADALNTVVLQQLTARFRELSDTALGDVATTATELQSWAREVRPRPRPRVASFADGLQRALKPVQDLPGACELMHELANGTRTLDKNLIASLPELQGCVRAVNAVLTIDVGSLQSQVEALAGRGIKGAKVATARVLATIKRLRIAHDALTDASASWRRATEFIGSQQRRLASDNWSSKNLTDRRAGELIDGRIELTRSKRAPDDLLHVRASVVHDGEITETPVTRTFRVVSVGMRLDIGPALLFLDPLGGDANDVGIESFRTTPAVSAVLHYRAWRGDGAHRGSRVWNFIDPGIGIHVAYPDLGVTERNAAGDLVSTDPTTEIGVGGVLNLFGDLIQVGMGYDLQVRRPYWFLGVGLKNLTDFGLSVPALGGS